MIKSKTKKQFVGTTIRIAPLQPTKSGGFPFIIPTSASKPKGFFDAFGPTGILLLLVAGISTCWTVWLIVLNVSPNDTANYLMDTADFDDGNFWLIVDPDPGLTIFNAAILAALATSYVRVLLNMTLLRRFKFRVTIASRRDQDESINFSRIPYVGKHLQKSAAFWIELTGYYGMYRKLWNVFFKFRDLVVESMQLCHFLEAGFSTGLPFGFDMLFAIVCPIVLLAYSYTAFDLDRALARLYLNVYFPGSFQRQARMQADPAVTTLFRFAFDSLRTLTWTDLVIRLAMNISFSYRLSRLVEVIYQKRRNLRTSSSKLTKLKTQRAVPRWVGALFIGVSMFALFYANKCISASQNSCKAYPQCVAFSYRWDCKDTCPCLALIDVDRAPKAYEVWVHSVDVTETVRDLAKSGNLQVLQLMNRQMVNWPEELQRCANLAYLSLYNTDVEIIPDWFKVFRKLEFLDLNGKFGGTNIVKMPLDAFSNMESLTFVHLGYLQLLPQLPSFQGLRNLKSMALALLYSITSLPELTPLVKLQRLELISLNSLQTFPEVSSNRHLSHLVIWQAPMCCNGFVGDCNISHPACSGMSRSDCVPSSDRPSPESLAVFTANPGVCIKNAPFIPTPPPLLKSQIDECGGVMYRQCRDTLFASAPLGICINSFFQVIACTSLDVFAMNGRRQEILHGLGTPCNPKEEAWLGCV